MWYKKRKLKTVLRKIKIINTMFGGMIMGIDTLIPKINEATVKLQIKEKLFFLLKVWTKKDISYFVFDSSKNDEQTKRDSLQGLCKNYQEQENAEVPLLVRFVTLRKVTCTFEGNEAVLTENLTEDDEIFIFDNLKTDEIILEDIIKEDSNNLKIMYISEYLKPLI